MSTSYRIQQFFSVFEKMDLEVNPTRAILDFGCGDGEIVDTLRRDRFTAYGCDISFKDNTFTQDLIENNFIRLIDFDHYKIPFDENTFDFVISDQVFEHVQNYDEALSEIKRVLKPGGACLHFFPSRYRFFEPHVKVPLATIWQSYSWLKFWSLLGIRKRSQKGWDAERVAKDNFHYLNNRTIYLTKEEIKKFFKSHFDQVFFCERHFLSSTDLVKNNGWTTPFLLNRFASHLYCIFKGRVVLAIKS